MSEDTRASLNRFHRTMWYVLVILAEAVGFFAGLAIGIVDFWIAPATGLMAMGMVIVLAETLYLLSKRPVEDRQKSHNKEGDT